MRRINGFTLLELLTVAVVGIGVFGGIEVSKRNELARRAVAEPWRQAPGWKRTKVTPKVDAPQAVIAAFEDDPAAPEERKAFFSFCLWPKRAIDRRGHVEAWLASIDSVKQNGIGWDVELTIAAKTGVCFTNARTHETWQVSYFGRPRCVACKGSGIPRITMCD